VASVLAGVAVAVVVTGVVGVGLGAVVAVAGPRVLARLEPRAVQERREQLRRDLPLTLDLLAACLAGGAALGTAADAVGRAVGGPAGERLLAVASALAVGVPAADAWGHLAGPEPGERAGDPFGPAARALGRAADGGAPVAAAVARLAVDVRADGRGRAEQAARRVGVLAVAPLGLCFLPAFVLLGIVPMVLSLAAPLLASP
jgi:pilus assembly protein TadC